MDLVRSGLLAVAVLCGAWAAARVVGYFAGPAHAESVVAEAMGRSAGQLNEVGTHFDEAREIAETLKKKNVFTKEPPKEHPVKQIDGILGREVLVGDKWYKAGEKVGDATIVLIEPTQVTIEWDDQRKVFSPLAGEDKPSEAPRSREPTESRPSERPRPQRGGRVVTVDAPVAATPTDDDPLGWMGVELPPALRAKLLERWNSASDEEKARGMEEWNKMSDEQKQQAVQSMGNL